MLDLFGFTFTVFAPAPVVQRTERSVADAEIGGSSPSGCANTQISISKDSYWSFTIKFTTDSNAAGATAPRRG